MLIFSFALRFLFVPPFDTAVEMKRFHLNGLQWPYSGWMTGDICLCSVTHCAHLLWRATETWRKYRYCGFKFSVVANTFYPPSERNPIRVVGLSGVGSSEWGGIFRWHHSRWPSVYVKLVAFSWDSTFLFRMRFFVFGYISVSSTKAMPSQPSLWHLLRMSFHQSHWLYSHCYRTMLREIREIRPSQAPRGLPRNKNSQPASSIGIIATAARQIQKWWWWILLSEGTKCKLFNERDAGCVCARVCVLCHQGKNCPVNGYLQPGTAVMMTMRER